MQISRRTFLLAAAAAACSCSTSGGSALQKAMRYLWAQQAEDGGFHSTTYGLLRSGQSLTPFILDTVLGLPESVFAAKPEAIDRALGFIKKNTNGEGSLGEMDETAADYPNYATALAVSTAVKAPRSGVQLDSAPMVSHLLDQQFIEINGWKPEDAVYGAWGMGGPLHRPPETGHVD